MRRLGLDPLSLYMKFVLKQMTLGKREMTNKCVKEPEDFINVFQILPRHVPASGYHLQWVVGAL
jgi:hypothetical protein